MRPIRVLWASLLASSLTGAGCSLDSAGTNPELTLSEDDGLLDASGESSATVDSGEAADEGAVADSSDATLDGTADANTLDGTVDASTGDAALEADATQLDTADSSPLDATDTADTADTSVADTADTAPPPDTATSDTRDSAVLDTGPWDTGRLDAGAPDTATFTDSGVRCTESGALVYRGHCYFLLTNALNFADARDACVSSGAHLVTITSGGEQAVVQTLGSGDRWIGLRQPGGTGEFEWFGGATTTNYDNWGMDEPNGSGDCARMNAAHQWADISCGNAYPLICERE